MNDPIYENSNLKQVENGKRKLVQFCRILRSVNVFKASRKRFQSFHDFGDLPIDAYNSLI